MKVFVASGYYDLATPTPRREYTLAHMGLDPPLRATSGSRTYEAGHMMYLHGSLDEAQERRRRVPRSGAVHGA